MQFSDEEVQNLREIFDLFDKERNGTIYIKDLEQIMVSLQRDPDEAKQLLGQIRDAQMNEEGQDFERINFDDFLKMMEQVE